MLCRAVGLAKSLQESQSFHFSFVTAFVGRICLNSLLSSPSGCGVVQPSCAVLGPVLYLLSLSLLWPHPGHALAQMLSALSLVTLSGFTLSSQVQLELRAGVLGTSSSSDYPSLPPSAGESRAGCFHPPAPAVPAQPRAAEESPPGEGILSPPSS